MSFLREIIVVEFKNGSTTDLPRCAYTKDDDYQDDEEEEEDDSTDSDKDEAESSESEDARPVVQITKDEICPNLEAANAMVVALQEMATCKGMFDKWAQELDRNGAQKKDDSEEKLLFDAVDELRDRAQVAMDASATILRDHETFAQEMADVLDCSGTHPTGDFYRPMEAIQTCESIMKQSELLSIHVEDMKAQLDVVLDLVEHIKTKRERRVLWGKVLKWLTRAFKVLATILTVGAFVLPFLTPIGAVGAACFSVGATLATYAHTLCNDLHETNEGDERTFVRMMDFLRYRIPLEAERSRQAMENFQTAHEVLQLDLKIKNGELVRISKYDANTARDEWRNHRRSLKEVNTAFQRSRDGYDF